MAASFAFAAIFFSLVGAGLAWPLLGWASLLVAPFVGSLAALALAALAFSKFPAGELDEDIHGSSPDHVDGLVARLRSVLPRQDAPGGRDAPPEREHDRAA